MTLTYNTDTTSKKKALAVYYSASGNTKAMIDLLDSNIYEIINVKELSRDVLDEYDVIVFGMSTWGRGMPPQPYIDLSRAIASLEGKIVLLMGSGRVDYEFFCGALDLYKSLLEDKNYVHEEIVRADGYPTSEVFEQLKRVIKEFEAYAFSQ